VWSQGVWVYWFYVVGTNNLFWSGHPIFYVNNFGILICASVNVPYFTCSTIVLRSVAHMVSIRTAMAMLWQCCHDSVVSMSMLLPWQCCCHNDVTMTMLPWQFFSSPLIQVSTLAKHELGQGQWSELIDFIMQSCNSTDPSQKEVCNPVCVRQWHLMPQGYNSVGGGSAMDWGGIMWLSCDLADRHGDT